MGGYFQLGSDEGVVIYCVSTKLLGCPRGLRFLRGEMVILRMDILGAEGIYVRKELKS